MARTRDAVLTRMERRDSVTAMRSPKQNEIRRSHRYDSDVESLTLAMVVCIGLTGVRVVPC